MNKFKAGDRVTRNCRGAEVVEGETYTIADTQDGKDGYQRVKLVGLEHLDWGYHTAIFFTLAPAPPETITQDGKEYQLKPELTVQDSHVYEEVVNVGWCGESGAPTVEVYGYTNYFTKWGHDLRDPVRAVEYRDRIEAEVGRERGYVKSTRRHLEGNIKAMHGKNDRLEGEIRNLEGHLQRKDKAIDRLIDEISSLKTNLRNLAD